MSAPSNDIVSEISKRPSLCSTGGSRQDPRSALASLRCAFNLLRILLLHVSYGERVPHTLGYYCLEVLGKTFQHSILLHTNAVASRTHGISSSPASKEVFTSACSLAWHYSQAHCPYADLRSNTLYLAAAIEFLDIYPRIWRPW